jgi:hypothetical protein
MPLGSSILHNDVGNLIEVKAKGIFEAAAQVLARVV